MSRDAEITALAWHEERQLLAVGWSNNELFVWNGQDGSVNNIKNYHNSSITAVSWSGLKLASADKVRCILKFV